MKNISAVSDSKDIVTVEYLDDVTAVAGNSNSFTINDTVHYPLLALTAYGRSWQGYASHGGVPLGKNLFDSSLIKTSTNSGVTCRNNNDGTFSFSGTLSSGIEFTTFAISRSPAKSKTVISEPGMYTISGIPSGTSGIYAYINLYYNGEVQYSFIHTNGGNTKEITSEMLSYDDFRFDIGFMVNGAFDEQTYYIQLEKNNVPTSFEPYYSNPNPDCPVPIESIGDSGSLTVTTQDGTAINISDIGIEGYGLPVSSGGNYTDDNGQQWICDELIVNADGTGKIIKHTKIVRLSSQKGYWRRANDYSVERYYTPKHYFADDWAYPHKPFLTHFDRNKDGKEIGGITVGNGSIGLAFAEYGTTTVDDFKLFLDNNDVIAIYSVITPSETEFTVEQITALQPLIDQYGAFTAYFMSTQDGIPTPENPVEIVSTADLYRTKTATITTGLPLRGIPVDSGGNYTDSSGQEWICDTLEYNYSAAVKKQRVAVIDSYNGETVESDYISTTGGLDGDASVIYPAGTVTETPLTADEINQLRNLETFDGITTVYNNGNADMSVEYLTSKAVSKAVMPIIAALRGDNNA